MSADSWRIERHKTEKSPGFFFNEKLKRGITRKIKTVHGQRVSSYYENSIAK